MFKVEKHLIKESLNNNTMLDNEFDRIYQREAKLSLLNKEIIGKKAELEDIEKKAVEKEISTKKSCNDLIESARQKAEEIKKDAWNEGYQLGREEAQEIINDAQSTKKNEMERFITQINEMREEAFGNMESEVIELCISMAEKVVNAALNREDDLFTTMIKDALCKIKCEGVVQVSMSRQDYIKRIDSDTAVFDVQGEEVTVGFTYNDELSEGDCIVETNAERVDASVSTAIKEIKRSVTEEGLAANNA